ncbi:MAG: bile acid:sodium symporter family protein [Alicyclobacillus sp.]|nr:bile acid:sodium symporter family protein [Alicyclobacillus sp.]
MKALQFVFNRLMVLWLIACSLVAFFVPKPFLFLKPSLLWLLAAVLFFMGLTLQWSDIGRIFRQPLALIVGIVGKWIVVPLVAYLCAVIFFSHEPQLAAGVIMDGSTPSGVSANLFTFLSGGTVALSVSMSAINTLISPLLTPASSALLAHHFVSVDAKSMFIQMVQVVLVPVLLGLVLRSLFRKQVDAVQPVLPVLSAITLDLIVLDLVSTGSLTISQNAAVIPKIIMVTCIQIVVTLILGWVIGAVCRLSNPDRKAIMFEVGIYNSGLGAALAAKNIGALASLPALANTIFNLIIGALVTAYFSYRNSKKPQAQAGGGQPVTPASGAGD